MSIAQEHYQKLDEIQKNKSLLMQYKSKMDELSKKRKTIDTIKIYQVLEIDNEIFELQENIKEIEKNNECSYLLKVSSILNDYYTTQDNEFEKTNTPLNKYDLNCFIEKRMHNNRGQLYSKYMNLINDTPLTIDKPNTNNDDSSCPECNSILILATNESYVVCDQCGYYDTYFEPSVCGLTYEQEINTETSIHFSYKRINHLRELLSQLQAKESSEIPHSVIESVKAEFRKARIQNKNDITQEKVKVYLKKLGFNRYYEHTRQLTNILSGTPPPIISNELYDKILNMFIDIQEPFELCCPKNRKNFFSYNYILYKFCELLDQKEHMRLFPLLKSREKLYQQDCIWKKICEMKSWAFFKSV